MKVIIAGSKHITNYELLCEAVKESKFKIEHIISGGARGVDILAERYAREHQIPITIHYSQWNKHGKKATEIRNKTMALEADACIAIWDGKSNGTAIIINEARLNELELHTKVVNKNSSDSKNESDIFEEIVK